MLQVVQRAIILFRSKLILLAKAGHSIDNVRAAPTLALHSIVLS